MIKSLWDYCTGEITTFPHILQGGLNISLDNGNAADLTGCSPSAVPGCEILKCDGTYIYSRDQNISYLVHVIDETGRTVKDMSIDDLDL